MAGSPPFGALADNPQSREEDEELEDNRRREGELADLLSSAIHAFNYEESTMNSSCSSMGGGGDHNPTTFGDFKYEDGTTKSTTNTSESQVYRDSKPEDQLKVLYDVRVREVQALRDEFSKYKAERNVEIGALKNKALLFEAEAKHLQLSLRQSKELLVEKSEEIKRLESNLGARDLDIKQLNKKIDDLNLEIVAYKSEINELRLKATPQPFTTSDSFNRNEISRVHQDLVSRLESQIQELTSKNLNLVQKNHDLSEDLKQMMTKDEDNNETIVALSRKVQQVQQQCKDLFLLGEAIKNESDHYKSRLETPNTVLNHESPNKSSDLETLKRLLLDKTIEVQTLQAKLRFYENDMDELFEYRKLVSEIYENIDTRPCNNLEHGEMLVFMQRQLQAYQQAVDDRNQQILTLGTVNKDLQEKIESMLEKTRTEIMNISQKYSLPQLERMNDDLQLAHKTIEELKAQLESPRAELKQMQSDLSLSRQKNDSLQSRLDQVTLEHSQKVKELNTQIEKLELSKSELQTQLSEAQNRITRLKEAQNAMSQMNSNLTQSDSDNVALQIELRLRDQLQGEMRDKIDSIETKYKQVLEETKGKLEKYKKQESEVRQHFSKILLESSNKMTDLGNENLRLRGDLRDFETRAVAIVDKLNGDLRTCEATLKIVNEKWSQLLLFYVENNSKCLSTHVLGGVKKSIETKYQKKIDAVEQAYLKKVQEFKMSAMS